MFIYHLNTFYRNFAFLEHFEVGYYFQIWDVSFSRWSVSSVTIVDACDFKNRPRLSGLNDKISENRSI